MATLDTLTTNEKHQVQIRRFEDQSTPQKETLSYSDGSSSSGQETRFSESRTHDIADILGRPYKVAHGEWLTTDSFGDVLVALPFIATLTTISNVLFKMTFFQMMRPKIKIEVRLNLQPFQQGMLGLGWLPGYQSMHEHYALITKYPEQKTLLPGPHMTTLNKNLMEMDIQYINYQNCINLVEQTGDMGMMWLYVIDKLRDTTGGRVGYSVFVTLTECQPMFPTCLPTLPFTFSTLDEAEDIVEKVQCYIKNRVEEECKTLNQIFKKVPSHKMKAIKHKVFYPEQQGWQADDCYLIRDYFNINHPLRKYYDGIYGYHESGKCTDKDCIYFTSYHPVEYEGCKKYRHYTTHFRKRTDRPPMNGSLGILENYHYYDDLEITKFCFEAGIIVPEHITFERVRCNEGEQPTRVNILHPTIGRTDLNFERQEEFKNKRQELEKIFLKERRQQHQYNMVVEKLAEAIKPVFVHNRPPPSEYPELCKQFAREQAGEQPSTSNFKTHKEHKKEQFENLKSNMKEETNLYETSDHNKRELIQSFLDYRQSIFSAVHLSTMNLEVKMAKYHDKMRKMGIRINELNTVEINDLMVKLIHALEGPLPSKIPSQQAGDEAIKPKNTITKAVHEARGKVDNLLDKGEKILQDPLTAICDAVGFSKQRETNQSSTEYHLMMNTGNYNGNLHAAVLGMDKNNAIALDNKKHLEQESTTSFQFICDQGMLDANPLWYTSNDEKTIIYTCFLDPWALLIPEGDEVVLHPTAYVANCFEMCTGEFEFELIIPMTKFHQGRLNLVYDPSYRSATTPETFLDPNLCYSKLWDISSEESKKFTCPFQFEAAMLHRSVSSCYGAFQISVDIPLVASGAAADNVSVIVKPRFKNVEFQNPCRRTYVPNIGLLTPSVEQKLWDQKQKDIPLHLRKVYRKQIIPKQQAGEEEEAIVDKQRHPTTDPNPIVPKAQPIVHGARYVTGGESVVSVNAYLKQFSTFRTGRTPELPTLDANQYAHYVYFPFKTASSDPDNIIDNIDYFQALFMSWSGSIVMRFTHPDFEFKNRLKARLFTPTSSLIPVATTGRSAWIIEHYESMSQVKQSYGYEYQESGIGGQMTMAVPYFSPYTINLIEYNLNGDFNRAGFYPPVGINLFQEPDTYSTTNTGYNIVPKNMTEMRSAGEDYQVGPLIGVPVCMDVIKYYGLLNPHTP